MMRDEFTKKIEYQVGTRRTGKVLADKVIRGQQHGVAPIGKLASQQIGTAKRARAQLARWTQPGRRKRIPEFYLERHNMKSLEGIRATGRWEIYLFIY